MRCEPPSPGPLVEELPEGDLGDGLSPSHPQNTVDKLIKKTNLALVIGTHSWREQFLEAITVSAGKWGGRREAGREKKGVGRQREMRQGKMDKERRKESRETQRERPRNSCRKTKEKIGDRYK